MKQQHIPGRTLASWSVDCPSGKKALGGGVLSGGPVVGQFVAESGPAGEATGWTVVVKNSRDIAVTEYLRVICAYVSP